MQAQSKVSHQRTLFPEPPSFSNILSYDAFASILEDLSKKVGINPTTVTKKVPSSNPSSVSAATIAKYNRAEERCAEANLTLLGTTMESLFKSGEFNSLAELDLADVNCFCPNRRYLILRIVEELNYLVCKDYKPCQTFYLGPGSAQVRYGLSSAFVADKLDLNENYYSIPNSRFTPEQYWDTAGDDEGLAGYISHCCHYSPCPDVIHQVPKNKDMNRTIGVGSVIGIAAQHCVGDHIRGCLRKRGYDLNFLARKHKEYAMFMSEKHFGATLDFSMASDTLSVGLVWLLLYNKNSTKRCKDLYLKCVNSRSDYYMLDGEIHFYEKVSAMGNSFTFELESLLFTAIARALTKMLNLGQLNSQDRIMLQMFSHYGSSFGDDMILPVPERLLVTKFPLIVEALSFLGLSLNAEKSYYSGSFRESCGADYRDGSFVRGFYLHNNRCYVSDLLRAWNFFHLLYDLDYNDLFSVFGSVISKLRLRRLAFDPNHCDYGACNWPHELRVPDNILLLDGGSSQHYMNTLAPKRVRVRELNSLDLFLMPGVLNNRVSSPIVNGQLQLGADSNEVSEYERERVLFPSSNRYYDLERSIKPFNRMINGLSTGLEVRIRLFG